MLRKKMRFIDEGGRALFHWGLCPLKTGLAAETISAIAGFGMFNLVRVLHDGFFSEGNFLPFLAFRHRSEQYSTCSQFFAQRLRQVMLSPQTRHCLVGRSALLPRKLCILS